MIRACHILGAVVGCVIALLLCGCEHKPLCYDHSHSVEVEIRFVWDAAPDADPATMVVSFFTPDGRYVTTREFTSRDGGKVRVEAGDYRLLFHNGEMDRVSEAVDVYERYGLMTVEDVLLSPMSSRMEAPRPSVSANEPVRSVAETVWAGRHGHVSIERGRQGQVVELYPEEVTSRYTVEVVNVVNLRDNIGVSAALSGLSGRYNICCGSPDGQPVTVPFGFSRRNGDTLHAVFLTFGHCPGEDSVPHVLSVYTSSKVCFNIDVTGQVHSAPDSRDVYVRIDGLTLPEDGQDVTPSVDGWDEVVNFDIEME